MGSQLTTITDSHIPEIYEILNGKSNLNEFPNMHQPGENITAPGNEMSNLEKACTFVVNMPVQGDDHVEHTRLTMNKHETLKANMKRQKSSELEELRKFCHPEEKIITTFQSVDLGTFAEEVAEMHAELDSEKEQVAEAQELQKQTQQQSYFLLKTAKERAFEHMAILDELGRLRAELSAREEQVYEA